MIGCNRLASDGINELLAEAISSLSVDLPKRDALVLRDGRVQGDWAGYERELQEALPVRTRDQGDTPDTNDIGTTPQMAFRIQFSGSTAQTKNALTLERTGRPRVLCEQISNRAPA
jgi:hypothetical protein